ncbi:lysophospholipid acyltransferase family protein [Nocardioides sp.]|uniref:lysophospholipid acyltransferase family protein n=1 Tax=Nocardioides sp. TaxID=35761 RepID=UPI002B26C414|nr:lysophospholipid acyltransferase family protein [Nocardioides sp.]
MTSAHGEHPRTDAVRRPRRWLLSAARPVASWLIRRRYRVDVIGADLVPATGPVILAANHIGLIDGPLVAVYSPRPVHALTKIEMFKGVLGRCLRATGQIPLDRFHTDPAAVKSAVRVLRDGGVVGVFPEGTRGSGELERFHRGAAYLAHVTGAPVVPVIIFGTREPGGASSSLPRRRGTMTVVFGTPYTVEQAAWPRTRAHVGNTSRLLRDRMLADLEAARRSTGLSLPGPLPAGQHELDPGGGITEKSA